MLKEIGGYSEEELENVNKDMDISSMKKHKYIITIIDIIEELEKKTSKKDLPVEYKKPSEK